MTSEDKVVAPPAVTAPEAPIIVYEQDGLRSVHNHEFIHDPAYQAAYQRGVQAVGQDYQWHWRVHVGLWAAAAAIRLPGDFVECGVNRGFLSSAIMEYLNWDTRLRTFYLLDTFTGLDERYLSKDERQAGAVNKNRQLLESGFYISGMAAVVANFAQWRNVKIVPGAIPETLPQVPAEQVAFLHLDMNCSLPEVAAAEYFWPRLTPGGLILLDDYAYHGFRSQKLAMDAFANSKGVQILSLPTGQGLLLKPAHQESTLARLRRWLAQR